MPNSDPILDWDVKTLFTPGPLTTSRTVKQTMMRDVGSRDTEFIGVVRDVRRKLVALGGADGDDYTAVLVQGSGTFGVEAVIASVVPPDGKLLVVCNGAYGERMVDIAEAVGRPCVCLLSPEDTPPDPAQVEHALRLDDGVTHVAVVHCETTTGIINPVREIGQVVQALGRTYIVDAMSSFGAVEIDLHGFGIDYLVSSSNKCIQGVPGFSFVLARRSGLAALGSGYARSLSLDLVAQWKGLESTGQFRFTPPTHALLAFHQALAELDDEGGVRVRGARYRANHDALVQGMRALGFREYLKPEHQGYIITSFHYPVHPRFDFASFYTRLGRKGYVIYPGKLSRVDCFRIGTIGHITKHHVNSLLDAIRSTLTDMDIPVPLDA